MSGELTLRETLDRLSSEGFEIPDDDENTIKYLRTGKKELGSPWYVRLFVGLSAWIAAILFIAFLFLVEIIDPEAGSLFLGLLFCAVAVGLVRLGLRNDFLAQLGLVLSLSGQILFFIGLEELFDNETAPAALGLILLELLLLWAYDDRLHRVISTLVISGSILAILIDLEIMGAIHFLFFAYGLGIVFLQERESRLLIKGWQDLTRPLSYGIAISLLGFLILPLTGEFDVRWWITAPLLLPILLYLIYRIVTGLGMDPLRGVVPWLFAGCLLLLVPAIRMPGILGALIILLLGFWQNNRLLIGLPSVFLVFFLGAYYYSLEWTLLVKSFALMGTGAIMFLLRCVLYRYSRVSTS